jgi:hypothetical protein
MAERSSANRFRSTADNDHPVRLPSVSSPTSTAPSTPSLASKPEAPSLSHASPSARYIFRAALIPVLVVDPFRPETLRRLRPTSRAALPLLHFTPGTTPRRLAWGSTAHAWISGETTHWAEENKKQARRIRGTRQDEELFGRGPFSFCGLLHVAAVFADAPKSRRPSLPHDILPKAS